MGSFATPYTIFLRNGLHTSIAQTWLCFWIRVFSWKLKHDLNPVYNQAEWKSLNSDMVSFCFCGLYILENRFLQSFRFWKPDFTFSRVFRNQNSSSQGWAGKAFWLPGTGREIENHIPVLREGNGNSQIATGREGKFEACNPGNPGKSRESYKKQD